MIRRCIECRATAAPGKPRCQPHHIAWDRARRGSTVARGYGSQHQDVRRILGASLPIQCGYGCGAWLTPDSAWVAAHVVDGDPSYGYIAACVTCNQRARWR